MRRFLIVLFVVLLPFSTVTASDNINRREAFIEIWSAINRPASETKASFLDVPKDSAGALQISYAKARGIIDDAELFHPNEELKLGDALTWLFRTRNIEDDPADVNLSTMTGILLRYPIAFADSMDDFSATVTDENLMHMMRLLDTQLMTEDHEVSLYAEDFHGDGTAFGETFDMYALTAAHRSFPHNTLVKVTNIENGKSVIVRINDRGPYVKGRDMDLSLASFTSIAERSRGKIRATFQRLGDATIVDRCAGNSSQQQRLSPDVYLTSGVPHTFTLGNTLSLTSEKSFVIRGIRYPDNTFTRIQDYILPGESFTLKPSITGQYAFLIGTVDGKVREMEMNVSECSE
jgi:rare lipoprotein A (peptidoglycan hydrolase)